jgi:hypothetical protein
MPIAMTDTTVLENTTEAATEGLAFTADNPSAQILRAIEIVEESLRGKRSRIEEIQMRRDRLVSEYSQLNQTLESEASEFVQQLNAVVNNLDTDGEIVALLPGMPASTKATDLDTDIADRDQQVRGAPDDNQDKPGSLRWLQKKERKRWEG